MKKAMRKPIRIDMVGKIEAVVPAWEGMLAACIQGAWYLADFDRGTLEKSGYEEIGGLSEGRVWAFERKNGKKSCVLLDECGSLIKRMPEKLSSLPGRFRDGFSRFSLGEDSYGFYDLYGRPAFDGERFTDARDFHDGYAFVGRADGTSGFIDRCGRLCEAGPWWAVSDVYDGRYIENYRSEDDLEYYAERMLNPKRTIREFTSRYPFYLQYWDGGAVFVPQCVGDYRVLTRAVIPADRNRLDTKLALKSMGSEGYIELADGGAFYVFEGARMAESFGKRLIDAWPFYGDAALVRDRDGDYHYIDRYGNYLEKNLHIAEAHPFEADFVPVRPKFCETWEILDRSFQPVPNDQRGYNAFTRLERLFDGACVMGTSCGERYLVDLRAERRMQAAPKLTLQSFAAFAESCLAPCAYDDSGDCDTAELEESYEHGEWLCCSNACLALDAASAYLGEIRKQKKLPVFEPDRPEKKWEDGGRFCLHIPIIGSGKDDPDVLIRLVAGGDGVRLRQYWRPYFTCRDEKRRCGALPQKPLPALPQTVCGVQGERMADACSMVYDFGGDYASYETALNSLNELLTQTYRMHCDGDEGVIYDGDDCWVLLRDGMEMHGDMLTHPGMAGRTYSAVLHGHAGDTACRIEARLSGVYRLYE